MFFYREITIPPIITDGLILNLDAGNPASYSGTGTTWYDLSVSGTNATLSNNPAFSSDNSGILTFDGVNDFASIPNTNSPFRLSSQVTYNFWIYSMRDSQQLMGASTVGGNGSGGFLVNNSSISFRWTPTSPDADRTITMNVDNTLNVWNHISFTMNYVNGTYQFYYNGLPISSSVNGSVSSWFPNLNYNQNIPDYIGARSVNSLSYFSGSISNVSVYNRILTSAEVLQNFNALKSRFGL